MKSHSYDTKAEKNISDFSYTVAMAITWRVYLVYWMAGSPPVAFVNAKQFRSWRADILIPCSRMAPLEFHVIWILASGVSCLHLHDSSSVVEALIEFPAAVWRVTLKFPSVTSSGGQERQVNRTRQLDLNSGIILWEDIEWSKWRQKAGMWQIALYLISVLSEGRFSWFIQRLFFLSS